MSPEDYALHRERVLWLSEHPLVGEGREDVDENQTSLSAWGAA